MNNFYCSVIQVTKVKAALSFIQYYYMHSYVVLSNHVTFNCGFLSLLNCGTVQLPVKVCLC